MWETLGAALLGAGLGVPVWLVPYTKVEESFTLQAVHDILTHGFAHGIQSYDHVQFPGAVPRSFLGPLLVAAPCAPLVALARLVGLDTSAEIQWVVRAVLALATWASLVLFARTVLRTPGVRPLFYVVCATQFHLVFWASRTTPNGVAFPLVTAALAGVLGPGERSRMAGLAALALITCTLRLEVVGLAAPAYLWAWLSGHLSLPRCIALGAASCTVGGAVSLGIDSYFWHAVDRTRLPGLGTYVWPEAHALLFNVVEGHSAEWGVAPWHAYFAKELPRLLAPSLPLLVAGLVARPTRGLQRLPLVTLSVFHTCLLSALAHKEWRFLVYTLPMWNALSAYGARACVRRAPWAGRALVAACIGAGAFLLALYTYVSAHNYPGGAALRAAHERIEAPEVHLHIDTLAAMTGVSLFQCTHLARPPASLVPTRAPVWHYNKTEGLDADAPWCDFTHLLTESANCRVAGNDPLFTPLGAPIPGLVGVRRKSVRAYIEELLGIFRARSLAAAWHAAIPVKVDTEPMLYVCKRTGC
ncbi:dolichyl-P-Man:Man7GlcNAc2-PP-dolichol alpha-1,6-mannosyltransferase [Malassezia brasiliensis]|uniref:Mannosyltransferase n=1 Tax=Malassezia brasiliensis TaxID=1821822 RepID=A0AAF0INH4_9BASI|nr:dolichyl-P-Man:Man7GlcNAc2-PP-dolichol alpha-1,6-mannosyltransferase [Malassezia brasiliensis]